MATCLIALGSNLGQPQLAVQQAIEALSAYPTIRVAQQSSPHQTTPVGGPDGQGQFVNAAVRLETDLSPTALFALLQQIELAQGRQRHERWASRPIDLDLLLYDEQVIETADLVIPHPRMSFRRFVLEPAAEVAAEMRHPQIGWTIGELLRYLNTAADYVAVTGLPGARKTRLARRLCDHFGGRLIEDPQPVQAVQPEQPGDPNGSQPLVREIEFLHRRAKILELRESEKQRKSFVVSDFWLGESLAIAETCQDVEARASFAKHWDGAIRTATRPKLILVLDAPAEFFPERDALQKLIRQGGHGPVLQVDAADAELVWAEATAAVMAMR